MERPTYMATGNVTIPFPDDVVVEVDVGGAFDVGVFDDELPLPATF